MRNNDDEPNPVSIVGMALILICILIIIFGVPVIIWSSNLTTNSQVVLTGAYGVGIGLIMILIGESYN
jgi:hypothetical protein